MNINKLTIRLFELWVDIVLTICSLFMIAMFTVIHKDNPSNATILYYIVISFFTLLIVLSNLLYFCCYSTFHGEYCIKRTIFVKRTFKITDIKEIKMQYPYYAREGILFFYAHNNDTLLRISKETKKLNVVIQYVQNYINVDIKLGETDLLNDDNSACLVIKPNKRFLNHIYFIVISVLILILVFGLILIIDFKSYYLFIILILLAFSICPGLILYSNFKGYLDTYNNFRAQFTSTECYVINEYKKRVDFKLEHISSVIFYHGRDGRKLELILSTGVRVPPIYWGRYFDNSKMIIAFLEKHLNRIIEISSIKQNSFKK